MTLRDQITDNGHRAQLRDSRSPYGEEGQKLERIFVRIMEVRRWVATLEGKAPDAEGIIEPRTIAGLAAVVDDTNPRAAHLRDQFWNQLEGHVDALRFRVCRAQKLAAIALRKALRSRSS